MTLYMERDLQDMVKRICHVRICTIHIWEEEEHEKITIHNNDYGGHCPEPKVFQKWCPFVVVQFSTLHTNEQNEN